MPVLGVGMILDYDGTGTSDHYMADSHVFANAHSALFVQHLNVLPDWDMFQTSHAYSGFHAAARCVSGGPIVIVSVATTRLTVTTGTGELVLSVCVVGLQVHWVRPSDKMLSCFMSQVLVSPHCCLS